MSREEQELQQAYMDAGIKAGDSYDSAILNALCHILAELRMLRETTTNGLDAIFAQRRP